MCTFEQKVKRGPLASRITRFTVGLGLGSPPTRFTVGLEKREIYPGGGIPPYHASQPPSVVYTPPSHVQHRPHPASVHANHAGQCADVQFCSGC